MEPTYEQNHKIIDLLIDIKYSLQWLRVVGNVLMALGGFFVLLLFPVFMAMRR